MIFLCLQISFLFGFNLSFELSQYVFAELIDFISFFLLVSQILWYVSLPILFVQHVTVF